MKDMIKIVGGDLLTQDVDMIVNAANTHLIHGAGVAGVIARAAGPAMQAESNKKRPIPTGGAIVTTAGELPFKGVVHAVGPVWGGGEFQEDVLLRFAHKSAVIQAARAGAHKLAFPAISCGIFGFPVERAAPIAVKAVRDSMDMVNAAAPHKPDVITEVRFVLAHPEHLSAYQAAWDALDE